MNSVSLQTKNLTGKLSFFGVLIGLLVPILGIVIDFYQHDIAFSTGNIALLYKTNKLHYIILTTPLFLGIAGYLIGLIIKKDKNLHQQSIEKEKIKYNKINDFVHTLIEDENAAEYEITEEDDILGESLIQLRDNLQANKKQIEQRKKEDDQRNWVAEGLAKFGEILRNDNDNIEVLSFNIINSLVKYIDANQGSFFIIHDHDEADKHFEMTACYAYDRKKFADRRIEWGEGLIGTCALEKETIYMTDVPETYVRITSGLGKATPRGLLIVPLVINDEVHGVIELASFKKFEKYQIDFIEKVAESIASTISSVKVNVRTSKLLKETQEQAEVLATQEEQMRQNMEELQATQEEAARQSEKFISFTNSVNHTLIRAEYATDGTLLYANTKFLNKLGYSSNSEVEGKHISIFIAEKDRVWFDPIWDGLALGGKHFEGDMKHMTKEGQDLWTMATYTCVRKEDGSVEKILFLAIDTTKQKNQSLDYEGQMEALNRSSIKVDFSPEGILIDTNELFLDSTSYSREEILNTTIFNLVPKKDKKDIEDIWKNTRNGIPFQGLIQLKTKNKEYRWYRCTFTTVNNMYNEVDKIVFIANDITKEKLMEIEFQEQNKQLKEQEEKLRVAGDELSKKLKEAKEEMTLQFREIEMIKIRNERTLEGALDAIITINKNGIIEFFNKAAEDLWGIKRKEAIGNPARMLFSKEIIENDDFVARYVDPEREKIVGKRQEIKITNNSGEELPVLILLSDAKLGDEHSFTAFIQNIEVELF